MGGGGAGGRRLSVLQAGRPGQHSPSHGSTRQCPIAGDFGRQEDPRRRLLVSCGQLEKPPRHSACLKEGEEKHSVSFLP